MLKYLHLILLAPCFIALRFDQDLSFFLYNVACIICMLTLLKGKWRVLLFPFIFIAPFLTYYIHFFKQNITSPIIFDILLQTNLDEVLEFTGKISLVIIIIGICLWFAICTIYCITQWKADLKHKKNKYLNYTSHLISFLFILFSLYNSQYLRKTLQILPPKTNTINNNHHSISGTIYIGTLNAFKIWIIEKQKQSLSRKKMSSFIFNAHDKTSDLSKNIVLVIGESARRYNWAIHGYTRQTNPLLIKENNIVPLNNMLSTANVTYFSVPMIITRKSQDDPTDQGFYEKSIVSAFKEAGFKTYWLSNQGKFDAVSFYAQEADEQFFPTKNAAHDMQKDDGIILKIYDQIINQPNQKKFIVIHMFGSHFDYTKRYPAEFIRFQPDTRNINTIIKKNKKYRDELINAYDNSIIYSDFILANLINKLKSKHHQNSFLLYTSDHGEALFDGGCNKFLHGHMMKNNFEIASFAWFSEQFRSNYTKKTYNLQNNANRPMNHTAIFPTILDAGDIALDSDKLERSILKEYESYPRKVMGIDFDQAKIVGDCEEIEPINPVKKVNR